MVNYLSENCPKWYASKTGINKKAICFSKRPYSDNVINIRAELIIKIKSKALFVVFIQFSSHYKYNKCKAITYLRGLEIAELKEEDMPSI